MSAIEAAARDRRTPRVRLLEAKDAVAQLNGSLEKVCAACGLEGVPRAACLSIHLSICLFIPWAWGEGKGVGGRIRLECLKAKHPRSD